jgi:TolA-binding protein
VGLVVVVAVVARAQQPPHDAGEGWAVEAPPPGIERTWDATGPDEPAPAREPVITDTTPVVEPPPGESPPADEAPEPDAGPARAPAAAAAPAAAPPVPAAVPAPSAGAAAPASPGVDVERLIEHVRLSEGPNGIVVRLVVQGPTSAPFARVLPRKGKDPARIYVDVPGAWLGPMARGEFRGRGGVKRVRTGQFDAKTARVVIELEDMVPYQVKADAEGASIVVRAPTPRTPAAKKPAAAPPAEKAKAPSTPRATDPAAPAEATPALPGATANAPAPPPAETPATAPAEAAAPDAPAVEAAAPPPAAAVGAPPAAPADETPPSTAPSHGPAVEVAAPPPHAATVEAPPAGAPTEETPPATAPPLPTPAAVVYGPEPPPAPAGALPVHGPPVFPEAAAADALPFAGVDQLGGAVFVWPPLENADYMAPDAERFRKAIIEWRAGNVPDRVPSTPKSGGSAAASYLAADLLYLEATAGRGDYWKSSLAYQSALRDFPAFADAPRAQFMLGRAELALGLGPEAGAEFATLQRRWPESPYVGDAHIGTAASLRLRHRPEEARRVLQETRNHATGALACRAERERIAQARVAGASSEILDAYQKIEQLCPDVLQIPDEILEYAWARAANGDGIGARALLTLSRPSLHRDDQARLLMTAGRIAADMGNRQAAEVEYALVAGMNPSTEIATELRMRRALLEGGRPEHLAATFQSLAKEKIPSALRAVLLGEAAEQRARGGNFEEAIAVLDDLAKLDSNGARQAEARRAEMLGRWINTTVTRGNDAAVAALYAAHATQIEEDALTDDRLAIAAALGRLGLHPAAVRLLLLTRAKLDTPNLDVEQALAEAAIAAGDQPVLRETLQRIVARPLPAEEAERVRRTLARAALRTGDVDTAASVAAQIADLDVRGEVAAALLAQPDGAARARALVAPALQAVGAPTVALLAAGDAAVAAEAWDEAMLAYDRALAGAEGAARLPAAAGLARAATAKSDRVTAKRALTVLEQGGDAVLARAAAAAGRAVARLQTPEEGTP